MLKLFIYINSKKCTQLVPTLTKQIKYNSSAHSSTRSHKLHLNSSQSNLSWIFFTVLTYQIWSQKSFDWAICKLVLTSLIFQFPFPFSLVALWLNLKVIFIVIFQRQSLSLFDYRKEKVRFFYFFYILVHRVNLLLLIQYIQINTD